MKKLAFILALIQMLCSFSYITTYAADIAVLDTIEFQDSKIGVFCENDSVKLDFKFANKVESITSYRFEITSWKTRFNT